MNKHTTLEKRKLGTLEVSAQGLGCMGMSEFYGKTNQEDSLSTLERAFELGVDFFDTADCYGFGANEELLRLFIAKHAREKLIIATKCGIVRNKNDASQITFTKGLANEPLSQKYNFALNTLKYTPNIDALI